MKRLYQVELRFVVAAENDAEADMEASKVISQDGLDREIYPVSAVDAAWLGAIPFGAEGDKTCAQYLAEGQTPAQSVVAPVGAKGDAWG